jgi:phage-related minor tail protein
MDEGPQLSSIASALSELTDRLAAIAETMTGSEREDVANALFEVERSLNAGSRRLEEVVRQLT